MRKIEKTVYKFDELSEEAKEKARDWFRNCSQDDTFWSESVIEDFQETLNACGFTVKKSRGSQSRPAIYFEGFCHQGSGASFNASWRASDVSVSAMIADRPVTYKDAQGAVHESKSNKVLIGLLERMGTLVQADREAYGNTEASSRYHNQLSAYASDTEIEMADDKAKELSEEFDSLCEDLAAYLYSSLETEYDYQNSDESVDENIRINDYEFDEDGNRA